MRALVMMGERRTARENPVWAHAARIARQRGEELVLAFADEQAWQPRELARQFDVFVLKSRSPLWINVAAGLSAYTSAIINSYASTLRVLNKFETANHLVAAALPVPTTWIAGSFPLAQPPLADKLMVKKVFGHRGEGVQLVHRDGLGALRIDPRDHFLQQFVEGREIKVKVLGEQLGAFLRHRSQDPYVTGDPLPMTPALRSLSRRVQQALDLKMFGMDVIESAEGLQIIDVNLVPSYRQFPQWAEQLATLISAPPAPKKCSGPRSSGQGSRR